MDFFSLFDPADGCASSTGNKQKPQQDTVKKKAEGGKGRRRGRRPLVTSECIESEESSFLCDPGLNPDSIRYGSYIESYLRDAHDVNIYKKPKCRNSSHKTRRKKSLKPKDSLTDDSSTDSESKASDWNNKKVKPPTYAENIGKNVNDLKNDSQSESIDTYCKEEHINDMTKKKDIRNVKHDRFCNENKNCNKMKTFDDFGHEDRGTVNSISEELDRVNILDNLYVSGELKEFDEELFNTDFSDDGSYDSESDSSVGCGCQLPRLPPEPRFGNVEYKLQLVRPGDKRCEHLLTQLKWRVLSGAGRAVYIVGARDDGALAGLRRRALRASLRTLGALAARGGALARLAALCRLRGGRTVAEVLLTQMPDSQQSEELRISVMGANEAGKSTLIGVLTQGELDSGAGSARLAVTRHLHEVRSGRTSSLSHHILGFDHQGNVVNYGCCALMTAARIGAVSARLLALLDQPGHSKYQRTTWRGLSGYEPHYTLIVISATAGITNITEEHLSIVRALDVPFFVVINKCDLAPASLTILMEALQGILRDKKLVLVTDDSCQSDKLNGNDTATASYDKDVTYVFGISCVSGRGLPALRGLLRGLPLPAGAPHVQERCEFQIDEIFHVGEDGPIVGGLLAEGQLFEGDQLVMGPLEDGSFTPVTVASIYRNSARCGLARAGHSASLRLCLGPSRGPAGHGPAGHGPAGHGPAPRPGHVLLAAPGPEGAATTGPANTEINKLKDKLSTLNKLQKNKKNYRRKNKKDLTDVNLTDVNLTDVSAEEVGDPQRQVEELGREMELSDVILEDPNNPRGCIYFQATVQVLRHATAIGPGFQGSVHVGNVRQTAVIEGILAPGGRLRAGGSGSVVFRFLRCPEFLRPGRRLLFTQGLATRAIGRVTQVFPYFP